MRIRRGAARLALLGAAAGAGWFVFVAWADRVDPLAVLPAGAAAAVDARDLEGVAARVGRTRFADAFAGSAVGRWVEGSEAVRALDDLAAAVRGATRLPVRRRHLLDVVGRRVAVAWYGDPVAGGSDVPWVAATRLSTRAWGVAHGLLLAQRAGVAGLEISREVIGGTAVVALPGGAADHAWHGFLAGRLLVLSNDRELLRRSVACLAGEQPALGADPALAGIRGRLPAGEAFLWARGAVLEPVAAAPGSAGAGGAVVRFRDPLEVHLFVAGSERGAPRGGAPPGLGMLAGGPPVFFSSAGPPPAALLDALAERRRAVAAADGAPPPGPLTPAPGFLVAVTGTAAGGPLALPRGVVAFATRGPDEAAAAVEALFPRTARTAAVAGTTARSTRESLPLAGELEVWGAALGARVVIATGAGEIEAFGAAAGSGLPAGLPSPPWGLETVAAVSGEKLLPLLRPAAPFLGGVLAARLPGAPNLGRDLALLAVLRSATLLAGADAAGRRALLALELRDLPAAP